MTSLTFLSILLTRVPSIQASPPGRPTAIFESIQSQSQATTKAGGVTASSSEPPPRDRTHYWRLRGEKIDYLVEPAATGPTASGQLRRILQGLIDHGIAGFSAADDVSGSQKLVSGLARATGLPADMIKVSTGSQVTVVPTLKSNFQGRVLKLDPMFESATDSKPGSIKKVFGAAFPEAPPSEVVTLTPAAGVLDFALSKQLLECGTLLAEVEKREALEVNRLRNNLLDACISSNKVFANLCRNASSGWDSLSEESQEFLKSQGIKQSDLAGGSPIRMSLQLIVSTKTGDRTFAVTNISLDRIAPPLPLPSVPPPLLNNFAQTRSLP